MAIRTSFTLDRQRSLAPLAGLGRCAWWTGQSRLAHPQRRRQPGPPPSQPPAMPSPSHVIGISATCDLFPKLASIISSLVEVELHLSENNWSTYYLQSYLMKKLSLLTRGQQTSGSMATTAEDQQCLSSAGPCHTESE